MTRHVERSPWQRRTSPLTCGNSAPGGTRTPVVRIRSADTPVRPVLSGAVVAAQVPAPSDDSGPVRAVLAKGMTTRMTTGHGFLVLFNGPAGQSAVPWPSRRNFGPRASRFASDCSPARSNWAETTWAGSRSALPSYARRPTPAASRVGRPKRLSEPCVRAAAGPLPSAAGGPGGGGRLGSRSVPQPRQARRAAGGQATQGSMTTATTTSSRDRGREGRWRSPSAEFFRAKSPSGTLRRAGFAARR